MVLVLDGSSDHDVDVLSAIGNLTLHGIFLRRQQFTVCHSTYCMSKKYLPIFRDIYYAKYYGEGVGGWPLGKKNKN